mgnify:CR=1 FL=1
MTSPSLSSRKRWIFSSILVLIPLLFFVILELSLRLTGYGENLDLVIKRVVNGKEYFSINRSVNKRYFTQPGIPAPEPADDIFEIQKSKNTLRIFCLGESTMAGFPYEFNVTAPSMLKDRLTSALPGQTIEVVNVGVAAVGSFVVLDFLQDLLPYEPDLFIVYLGHNEFYGIFQPGSALRGFGGRRLTNIGIRLIRFKTYLLLRNIVSSFQNAPTSTGSVLMEQMMGEQKIPYGSPLYQESLETYVQNLQSMMDEAKSHGIPIMFSALVSNIRTQVPFAPLSSTPVERQKEYDSFQLAGDSSFANKDYSKAIVRYAQSVSMDSMNASGFFKLGVALTESGRIEDGRLVLSKAKDLDAIRFRASEDFQRALFKVCTENEVPVARSDSAFEANSAQGIVGSELMTEHVHPNIEGYFIMAKTWFSTIRNRRLLARGIAWSPSDKPDDEFRILAPITDFDKTVGHIRIQTLLHHPPFAPSGAQFEFVPNGDVERIAYSYARQQIYWSDARYKLAEFYASQRDYRRARAECLAIAKVVPTAYQPMLQMADYYSMEGKAKEAEANYLESIKREDNPFARFKLAYLLLHQERAGDAASQLEDAFRLSSNQRFSVKPDAVQLGRYLLGVAYAKLGQFELATQNAQRVLETDPKHAATLDLLRQIQSLRNKQ